MRKSTFVFIALIATLSPAQETFRVDTRLVQVTAIVRDKRGPVIDLTKDDFEITDKGKPRKIATFSMSRESDRVPPSTLPPNTYSNKLNTKGDPPVTATVVLFDQLNTEFTDQAYARKQAQEFLKSIDPQGPMAIYVLGNGLRILHDFTDDPAILARALERSRNGNSILLGNSSRDASAQKIIDAANDAAAVNAAVNPGASAVNDPMTQDLLTSIFESVERYAVERRIAMTMSALQVVASRLSGVPGRKNILWISGGFPLSLAFSSGLAGRSSQFVTYSGQMKGAASALDRANVAIYPVDARGLMGSNNIRVAMPELRNQATQGAYNLPDQMVGRNEQDSMNLLANWTGGKAFYNTNNLRGALKQATEDAEVVYTLGFYVDQKELDGTYHDIKVKLRKPGDVRYRHGYFAVPIPTAASSAGTILMDAALGPADATGIGLLASLTPDPSAPGTYLLALGMDLATLQFEEKNSNWVGGLNIGIIQQAADGNVLDSTGTNVNLDLTPENREKLKSEGMTLRVAIRPAPGMTQIRAAVMDRTSGNVGSLRIPGPK